MSKFNIQTGVEPNVVGRSRYQDIYDTLESLPYGEWIHISDITQQEASSIAHSARLHYHKKGMRINTRQEKLDNNNAIQFLRIVPPNSQ